MIHFGSFNQRAGILAAFIRTAPKELPHYGDPDKLVPVDESKELPVGRILSTIPDAGQFMRIWPRSGKESLDAYAARIWQEAIQGAVWNRPSNIPKGAPVRRGDVELLLVNVMKDAAIRGQRSLREKLVDKRRWQGHHDNRRYEKQRAMQKREAVKRDIEHGAMSTIAGFITDYSYSPLENLKDFVERVHADVAQVRDRVRHQTGGFSAEKSRVEIEDEGPGADPEAWFLESGLDGSYEEFVENWRGSETMVTLQLPRAPKAEDILFGYEFARVSDLFDQSTVHNWLRSVIRYHRIRMQRRFWPRYEVPAELRIEDDES